MKFNKKNFDLMSVAGGMVGGVVAKFVEKFTTSKDSDGNGYLTIAVQAGLGAAISAFSGNSMSKAAGAGMIGAAGVNLANTLHIGEDKEEDTTAGAAGIGLLPGQLAVGNANPFRYNKQVKGKEVVKQTSNVI